ncbi:MAG TPA: T9SS type A sorting domain-containing protein, partial [Caldithrix abyssi]|nr:T9SS type A sorting domain-containing protein [Caldithrix abyssi]
GYAVGDGGRIFKTTSGGLSVINKVFLTSPSDGAVGVDTTVRCEWQQDSEAAEYLLQVATEPDFNGLIFQDSLITPFSTRIPGLAPGRSYYWRVRAVNALGKGPWSDVWTFQTKQPAPRLHAPVNKSGGLERRPTLTWQDLNAPLYHIQIAPEGNFDYISEEQTTTDTFFVPQDLEYDRTYYWRVRVEDENAPGYWSDEYSFTIRNGLNGWTRQWSGTNGMLCSAAFTEPQTGYAVGTNGTILKTENGGAEWQPITSGVEYHLEAVTFLDDRTGFAVGWGGTILRTDDSGRSWQQVPSGINTMLRSVVFNNRQTGWAVGEKGVILRTGNGGQSWSTFFSNVDYDFYQAFFSNDSCGWIVGGKWSGWEYNPVVFRTIDGGSNWVISSTPGQDAMRAVFFISPQKGWIAGTRGQILRTQNGGVTWSLQQSDKSYELRSLAFTSEEQGWAVGSRGTALVTSDGGQSWQPMETGTGYILRTVVFADADHGWMMGNQGYILKTASGGHVLIPSPEEPRNHAPGQPVNLRVRWNDVPEAAGYHLQVARDPSFTDLLYENGNILTTVVELPQLEPNQTYYWRVRSAYRNQSSGWSPVWNFHTAGAWQEQFSTTNRDLYGVDFRDAFNGLAVGEDGTILITADGGKIWKQTQIATHVNLYDVAWQSSTAAWAVGDSGRVWYTSDGGRTWQKKYSGESFRFRHILAREGNQIWITGVREISGGMSSGAVLLTSADRGASWQLRTVSKLEMVHDLAFTKSGAAFLIGAGSQTGLLKSWDQGATWQPVPVNGEKEFTAIRFNDRDEGYLLSANGNLYLTEDDGESWEKIGRQPVTGAANKLALLGSGKMLTVGKGIWHSANEGVQWQALFPDSTFNDCDFVDDVKGWIVGPKGLILQTTTGGAIATSVPTDKETLPENFILEQNFPNPFNPKTVIRYRLPAAGLVELSVYSVLGQKVATLVTGKQKAGVHTVQWNGSNMASGVYFYCLKTNAGVVLTKKMILLR